MSLQRLRSERDSLKETIEELRCVQAQEGQLTTQGNSVSEAQARLFVSVASGKMLGFITRWLHPKNKNLKLEKRPWDWYRFWTVTQILWKIDDSYETKFIYLLFNFIFKCLYILYIYIYMPVSQVRLFAALWTGAHQAPLSVKFSRWEYWSRLPYSQRRDWTLISCVSYIGKQFLYR